MAETEALRKNKVMLDTENDNLATPRNEDDVSSSEEETENNNDEKSVDLVEQTFALKSKHKILELDESNQKVEFDDS